MILQGGPSDRIAGLGCSELVLLGWWEISSTGWASGQDVGTSQIKVNQTQLSDLMDHRVDVNTINGPKNCHRTFFNFTRHWWKRMDGFASPHRSIMVFVGYVTTGSEQSPLLPSLLPPFGDLDWISLERVSVTGRRPFLRLVCWPLQATFPD